MKKKKSLRHPISLPSGVFFDEVYVGAPFLGGAQVFDLERIEVLRGPQGTLFGKNTTAGAVSFNSKRPKFANEGELTLGAGSYNLKESKGALELPLVDNRLTARFAFTALGKNPRINPFDGSPLSRDQVATDRSGVIEVRGNGGYLTVNKNLESGTITSITSLIHGGFLNLIDVDGTINPLAHADFHSDAKELSQDLRYSSNWQGPLQLITGLYHQPDLTYSDSKPTGRIGLSANLAKDVFVFGHYARGYRSSAFNAGAIGSAAELTIAKPETLDSYEVGVKSQWFERALTLNATAFLSRFKEQQFLNITGLKSGGQTVD